MIRECGGEIVERKLINDGRKLVEEIQRNSKNCDIFVLCGGSRVLNYLNDLTANVVLARVQTTVDDQAFFFPLTDSKSTRKKIVFGLPGFLPGAVFAFNLLVNPSLKQMMGSSMLQRTLRCDLGEDISADLFTGEYHPVYFHQSGNGLIVAKSAISSSTNRIASLVGAHGLVHLPINSTSDTYFLRGTVVDVVPMPNTRAAESGYIARTHNGSKPFPRMVKVGIIAVGEVLKKNLIFMSPLINRLFSSESELATTNVSENVAEITKALVCWSGGSSAKQVIFTIGAPSPNGNNHVCEVTEMLVDRKLNKVSQKLTQLKRGGFRNAYHGIVGIRKNSLIVNLPEQVEFAKYCLEKLMDYVETIVHVLEK